MPPDPQDRADALLAEALERLGAPDPREVHRERLRDLKQTDPAAYQKAVEHYRTVLLPSIADEGAEPLTAWAEYGRTLAELTARGRTVSIDATGRSVPYGPPPDPDHLVLHLPEARNQRALLVALPRSLSDAQQATYDWLVSGKQTLRS